MACEMVEWDLDDYEFRCNEISCQWDEGRIKRRDFEKNCLLIAVSLCVGRGFESIIAHADDFLFGLVDCDPLVLVLLNFRRQIGNVHTNLTPTWTRLALCRAQWQLIMLETPSALATLNTRSFAGFSIRARAFMLRLALPMMNQRKACVS